MLDDILEDLMSEIQRAGVKYGQLRSSHEGFGVLAEEVAELLEAIRYNKRWAVQLEAIQVAAVALRIAQSMECEETVQRSGML